MSSLPCPPPSRVRGAALFALAFGLSGQSAAPALARGATPYPFRTEADIAAVLKVGALGGSRFNNRLLGLNCGWPGTYGDQGYDLPAAREFIRAIRPVALRWPDGAWGNFYDWESDGLRIQDAYDGYGPYARMVPFLASRRMGIGGFAKLHGEIGFGVVHTWNVSFDTPEKGRRRLLDYRARGLPVEFVELGNENFWKDQRSELIRDERKFISAAIAMTAFLKSVDPGLEVSVPVTWRNAARDPWNLALRADGFFDAVSVHRFVGGDSLTPPSIAHSRSTLGARAALLETGREIKRLFPEHPIWLTEWGVTSGPNALSVLGMADCFLGMAANPDLFAMANYLQVNGRAPLYEFDPATGLHLKNSHAAAYEILRSAFEDGETLPSAITTSELMPGLDAVSAACVRGRDGITVIALNKSDRAVPFAIEVKGMESPAAVAHSALAFRSASDYVRFGLDADPLAPVAMHPRRIVLPPLSLNRISVSDRGAVAGSRPRRTRGLPRKDDGRAAFRIPQPPGGSAAERHPPSPKAN